MVYTPSVHGQGSAGTCRRSSGALGRMLTGAHGAAGGGRGRRGACGCSRIWMGIWPKLLIWAVSAASSLLLMSWWRQGWGSGSGSGYRVTGGVRVGVRVVSGLRLEKGQLRP